MNLWQAPRLNRRSREPLDSTLSVAPRKIIHVDMDAFYASVEQRDDPALRGRPVAVGGSKARGVVAAASYEARVYGVRSAMPSVTAIRRCPDLVFVKPRFEVYSAVSQQIRAIFADYTDLVEPLSLDEAYLDVSEDRHGLGSARAIAEQIRARIKAETNLTASAGVSYNKFIAKLASDQNKPDGLCVIPPHRGAAFVAALPVSRFHGVGPVTAARMEKLGIVTGADLRDRPLAVLQAHFGQFAGYLHRAARGEDDRPVRANRPHKSIGAERTLDRDLSDRAELREALERVAEAAWQRIDRHAAIGRTVTLKLRYSDFSQITRARTNAAGFADRAAILAAGWELLAAELPAQRGIRLVGLTLSGLIGLDEADDGAEPRLL
jgi:DNA polymerase-4